MAAINAAWELIGDPGAARGVRPEARSRGRARPHGRGSAEPATRRQARTRPASDRTTRGSDTAPSRRRPQRPPEVVSRDWTSGRSTQGGGFDESMRAAEGFGAAGPPPGRPSGTVLNFGRYAGWSLGEVARHDIEYIEWLDRAPIGRNYRAGDRRASCARAGGARSADRRRRGPARALPPALGGSEPVEVGDGSASAARPVAAIGRDRRRSTTRPIVVPWTSSVNRTTPKVISWSRSRCGMSAGSDSAIATATAPRRPAQNRTWSQPAGTCSASPGRGAKPRRPAEQDVDDERPADEDRRRSPRRSARASRAAEPAGWPDRRAGTRPPSGGRRRTPRRCRWRPTPVSDIARPGPKLPSTIAAVTVAMTPDSPNWSASDVAAVGEHDRDRQLDQVVVDERR